MILCQLLLQAQQAFFISGLHQFMNQGSGREEADGEPLLAGRQTETEGDMGLAGLGMPLGRTEYLPSCPL